MYDYGYNDQPWAAWKNSILKVVVKDGVTRIGNGTYTRYTYENGQCTKLIHYEADGQMISCMEYTYDSLGHISSMTDESGTWYYTYDSQGQLVGAVAPDGFSTQYAYDAAGNRTKVTSKGKETLYAANELNQYVGYGKTTRQYGSTMPTVISSKKSPRREHPPLSGTTWIDW